MSNQGCSIYRDYDCHYPALDEPEVGLQGPTIIYIRDVKVGEPQPPSLGCKKKRCWKKKAV
jgi:hypothetical protein